MIRIGREKAGKRIGAGDGFFLAAPAGGAAFVSSGCYFPK